MAAPYDGKAASFYIQTPGASATLQSGEAMTQVGSTLQYYITDRAHAWWSPNHPVVVKDSGSAITTGYKVDHAGGYVTLSETPSGAVTVDCYTIPMEKLGGGFGWSCSKKAAALDSTIFPNVAGTLEDKSFIGGGLIEWSGSLKRHFYYARASKTTSQTGANNDLVWTWKASGSFGNDELLAYTAAGSHAVSRVGHTTTVTYVDNTTTADDVKATVAADPALSLLWDVQDSGADDGSGVLTDDFVAVNLTGGRDSTQEIARLATKVLCVFYLETDTATSARLEGVGIITNLNFDDPLEGLVESDLEFSGTGDLCYHAN